MREGLLHLAGTGITLLGLRLHLMGSKPPDFAPADNPAADSDSLLTRTLTFLYLPAFNFWLMLYPRWLSFDWSMEAIPLLTSPLDLRNIVSILFYGSLLTFACWLIKSYNRRSVNSAFYESVSHYMQHSHTHVNHASSSNGVSTSNGIAAGQWCSCFGITQKIALSFTPNNTHKSNKKSTAGSTGNNSAYSNGHRVSNGHYHNGSSSYVYHNGTSASSHSDGYFEHWKSHTHLPSARSAFTGPADIVTFALALLILPFIPATNLFFYVGFVVAERVLYIPSMGFCLLVALGVDHLYRKQESISKKRLVLIATCGLMIVMSVRTVIRNTDWLNEENLYRSGIPVNPPKGIQFLYTYVFTFNLLCNEKMKINNKLYLNDISQTMV